MPTRTKTVVFTDMVDFTMNTARSNRAGLRDLVTQHEAHTRRLFEPHGGELVKNIGDSFMCLFDSATDALRASLELVESKLSAELPLGFRASAATGDVEVIGNDCFGEAVNLSARINSKTPSGQLWFAHRTRLCMNQAELPWESVGTLNLKGIPDPIPCYRAVARNQCILPQAVVKAIEKQRLVVLRDGDPVPSTLGGSQYVLITGPAIASPELRARIAQLPPQLPPSQIWLRVLTIPGAERRAWLELGHGLVVGTPTALDSSMERARPRDDTLGLRTMFFDEDEEEQTRTSVSVCGLALPEVPIQGVIDGYSFDLLPDRSWGFAPDGAIVRVTVDRNGVQLVPFQPDVTMDGRRLQPGEPVQLNGGEVLATSHGDHRYIGLSGKYRGMFAGPASQTVALAAIGAFELGREPQRPGLALPSRGGVERIRWAAGPRAAKARERRIDLDRTQTGRRQTRLRNTDRGVEVERIHPRLPTYRVTRGQLSEVKDPVVLGSDEFIVVGAFVLQIGEE
ncbi:MAG: hypothetical protein ACI9K2_002964 [Myxococcota bacterium]|jgi:hypothetical protein